MGDGSRSSAAQIDPAWLRWVLPSIADLIFVAVLAVLVLTPLSVKLLGDAGVGWHISTGREMLVMHSIPRVDSFSSSASARPWFAWEWLYDLVVGQLDVSLGLNGVVWFTAVTIAAAFACLFRMLLLRGTHLIFATALLLLALSASTIHFLARPHVLSWLFALIWFWILDSSERRQPAATSLWLLPPLMLVWANLHGAFLIGFVLLAIFWIAALWDWFRAKETRLEDVLAKISAARRARRLTRVALLSLLASFVNPYGWKLHAHIYSYLTNRFLMEHIDEFQSPNFHSLAPRCFLALLLLTLAVLILRGHSLRLSHLLTALFAIYAGLTSARNLPFASILLVMIAGPLIPAQQGFARRMSSIDLTLRGHAWPILAAILTFILAASGGRLGSAQLMDAHFDPNRMPVQALDYALAQHIPTPILSPDYWGGYLIYRLRPAAVVVDDRHDLYGEAFFRSYLKMIRVEPGWQDFLRDHPAGCLMLPRSAALTAVLLESRDWKAVYSDEVTMVFVPASEGSASH